MSHLIFILVLGIWLIGLIELISIQLFWPFAFHFGITVFRKTISIAHHDKLIPKNVTIHKAEGKFRFTDDNRVYFLSNLSINLKMRSPFPLKAFGIIRQDGKIDIIAKISIGSTLFIFLWLIGWTIGTIAMVIGSGNLLFIFLGLFGWGFVWLMYLIGFPTEMNRMSQMVAELESIYY